MPYTRCPACATGFRIGASQLSTAGGMVRCGRCGARFDALQTLSDDPSGLPSPSATHDYLVGRKAPEAPRSDDSEAPDLGALLRQAEPEPPTESQTPPLLRDAGDRLDLGALLREVEAEGPARKAVTQTPVAFPERPPDLAGPYPDYKTLGDAAKPRLAAGILKGLSILALTLALPLQLLWFEREQLVYSPQGHALLGALCRLVGCEPPPRRDPGQFEIIRRGILPQDQRPGVLQLGLVFVNQADFPQPYPLVRVTLLSPQGAPSAGRTLSPSDYLAPGANETGLVQPQQPVRVTMELVEPDAPWAGYRFDFL